MKSNVFKGALGLIFVAALGALPARAITYTLGNGNSAISGFTGPYATVDVNLTSATSASIDFYSSTVGGIIYLLGDGGSVGVNVNATSWTVNSISGANSAVGFTPGPYSDGGAGNEDGWGSFNQTINGFDGYTHSADHVSFNLVNTSGTWANAASVLTANASGFLAAAHIFVTAYPADPSAGALATGFAADGSGSNEPPPTPDGGSTVALLGCALGGLGAARRMFRKN